jgi:imidazole glycerol-phosphate synthase subunit HisH
MKGPKIAELDFGMGNIRSLQKAFEHLGASVQVTSEAADVDAADVLLLPGDGAFARAMHEIQYRGLKDSIMNAHAKKKIIFGVCIGFQLFFENSTEFSGAAGLGLVDGSITRLEKNTDARVIPHMGWTTTRFESDSVLGRGLPEEVMFYYVHSYAAKGKHAYAAATTDYGQLFTSVIEHENLYAVQFHPEKSHTAGLKLIENFLKAL